MRDSSVSEAVDALREESESLRGAVYTRPEVVEFIMSLSGYVPTAPLWTRRFLEPSAGSGSFLMPAIERLLDSYRDSPGNSDPVGDMGDKIRAVEIHRETCDILHERVVALLRGRGFGDVAEQLAEMWLIRDDFLLAEIEGDFDFVIGNPPYVRQELIPDRLLAEYRCRYNTIYDRADLYIPFIERSLSLLAENGRLGFICSDRWMKNRYGQPLRKMVADRFSLLYHVDMVGTDAFEGEVSAYPAITVIARERQGITKVAKRPMIEERNLSGLARSLESGISNGHKIHAIDGITSGSEPWILDQFDELAIVRKLESRFPAIEQSGCKIGIGVATGADKVFIAPFEHLPVEESRKEPLVMASDIRSGVVQWSGRGVVNPFAPDGKLVPLAEFPLLRSYLDKNREAIQRRNVAKRNPGGWYRTIDRIYPELTRTAKLLIPDIKGKPSIVHEPGNFYPHHNLYVVTSQEWPLTLLQVVLRSTIARLFVEVYSLRMRGGYLRFQAQYLRRIRLPRWETVPERLKLLLLNLDPVKCSVAEADTICCEIYDISETSIRALAERANKEK